MNQMRNPTLTAVALLCLLAGPASCASSRAGSTSAPQPGQAPASPVGQTPATPADPTVAVPTPRVIQPGAPGEASRTVSAASTRARITHAAADVAFMKGMIGHHSQALEMTELLRARSQSDDMKLLAMRIDVSQSDEIKFMQTWLRERGEEVPGPHAHHMPGGHMPGMLTPDQMNELAAARGPAFDALFLRYMIQHHEGALVMVHELFEQNGAGQEAQINAFASDVVADQQMEIDRMAGMLRGMQK